jgi:hypothetical protein
MVGELGDPLFQSKFTFASTRVRFAAPEGPVAGGYDAAV